VSFYVVCIAFVGASARSFSVFSMVSGWTGAPGEIGTAGGEVQQKKRSGAWKSLAM
jgi:hypothetical protein